MAEWSEAQMLESAASSTCRRAARRRDGYRRSLDHGRLDVDAEHCAVKQPRIRGTQRLVERRPYPRALGLVDQPSFSHHSSQLRALRHPSKHLEVQELRVVLTGHPGLLPRPADGAKVAPSTGARSRRRK